MKLKELILSLEDGKQFRPPGGDLEVLVQKSDGELLRIVNLPLNQDGTAILIEAE